MATTRTGRLPVPSPRDDALDRAGRADGAEREVGWIAVRPRGARALCILAHGAGAGMHHPFMESLAAALARHRLASFRYQFPYMEAGSRRPDSRAWLVATVRAAVAEARRRVRGLPAFAGGKSMGGRMTSLAASQAPLRGVAGLVFFGFPLHPRGEPGVERAAHLADVDLPMLFLQGRRDALAEIGRMRKVVARLGRRATLREIDEADHGFHVPKRSGRTDPEVIDELAARTAAFAEGAG